MIFNALAIAVFSMAAWQDHEPWRSGFSAGVALCVAYRAIREYLEERQPLI